MLKRLARCEPMLETIVYGNTLMQYLEVAAIALAALVLSKAAYWAFKNIVGAAVRKTKSRLDDELVDKAEEPLVILVFIAGLYWGLLRLSLDGWALAVGDGAYIATAAVLTWLAMRLADIFVKYWLAPTAKKTKSQIDDQLVPIAGKLLKLLIAAFALYVVLLHFHYDLTALIAGLGVGGLAVALATKDYLENIVGGMTIFTDKPFKIGDLVEVNGTTGFIEEVGIRTTRLLTFDNTLVIIPNSQMVSSKLINVSEPNSTIAITMTLGLTYDTSIAKIKKAKGIIKKAITSTKGIDKSYTPLIYFTEFGDSALKLWVKYRVASYDSQLSITDEINSKIKEGFEKAKIDMAYPTQTVYLKK